MNFEARVGIKRRCKEIRELRFFNFIIVLTLEKNNNNTPLKKIYYKSLYHMGS